LLIYFTLRELKYRILAYEKETEMSRMKSNSVSLASHEFRTPLSTIMLSAVLVDKYAELHHDDSILKHSNKIKAAVNNLKIILDDFLSLEKLNTGKVRARLEPFNLVKLCEDIAEEMSLTLISGQELFYEHHGLESVVVLDENLLRNAIINLVSNAIKYSGDGAVIEIVSDTTGDHVTISIKDNGIGIAEQDQKELFSPFYRINHTGKIPGTGLGLNIVQRYVNLMNGTITFASKPSQGAAFRVSFPK
jgi:signal transduction histidine kinase